MRRRTRVALLSLVFPGRVSRVFLVLSVVPVLVTAMTLAMALVLVLAMGSGAMLPAGGLAGGPAMALAQAQTPVEDQPQAQVQARAQSPARVLARAVVLAPGQPPSLTLGTGSTSDGGQAGGKTEGKTGSQPATAGGLIIDPGVALDDEAGRETGLSLDQLGQAIGLKQAPQERARLRLRFDAGMHVPPAWTPEALHLEVPKVQWTPDSRQSENTFTILKWGTARVLLGDGTQGKWLAAEQRFHLTSSWEAQARLLSPVHSGMVQTGAELLEGVRVELAARLQGLSVEASLPVKDESSLQAALEYELGKGARVNAAYRVDTDGISIRSSTVVGVGLSLGENASLSASYRLVKWNETVTEEGRTETPEREAEAALQFRF